MYVDLFSEWMNELDMKEEDVRKKWEDAQNLISGQSFTCKLTAKSPHQDFLMLDLQTVRSFPQSPTELSVCPIL